MIIPHTARPADLECFSNAQYDSQASIERCLGLTRNELYSRNEPLAPIVLRFRTAFLSTSPSLLFLPLLLPTRRARLSYIIRLMKDHSPLTMPAQRPAYLTVLQLLRADLSRKSPIGLVEHILTADFNLFLEMFPYEQEEEARRGNDDFGFGIEGSRIEIVHYVCD